MAATAIAEQVVAGPYVAESGTQMTTVTFTAADATNGNEIVMTTGRTLVIVQNTAPWTFFGPFPVNPCPRASFDLGLDVFAPHSLGVVSTVRYGLRMLRGSRAGGVAGGLTLLHDAAEFTVRAGEPTSLQVDGDAMGQVQQVHFRARAGALRIVG